MCVGTTITSANLVTKKLIILNKDKLQVIRTTDTEDLFNTVSCFGTYD